VGQTNNPQVSVDFTLFDDTACTTNAESHPSGSLPDANNTGWLTFTGGMLLTTTKLSIQIDLVVHGTDTGDAGYFDKIALSAGALGTRHTAGDRRTPLPTNTPAATNTPAPTNTAMPTDTPPPDGTPAPTDTPAATNTAVPPTNASTPETPGLAPA
jgi:hypothetical protein